jgi:hypothetical protein
MNQDTRLIAEAYKSQSRAIAIFGKRLFAAYQAGKLSLDRLIKAYEAFGVSSHNTSVLGAFCSQDKEATLALWLTTARQNAEESYAIAQTGCGAATYTLLSDILITGLPLDKQFKCHEFTPGIVDEWRKVFGDNWNDFLKAAQINVERYLSNPEWKAALLYLGISNEKMPEVPGYEDPFVKASQTTPEELPTNAK